MPGALHSIAYRESEILSKPYFKFEFEHPHFIWYIFCTGFITTFLLGDRRQERGTNFVAYKPRSKQYQTVKEITKNLEVPMKFIHIVGNPFDIIATMVLRGAGERDNVREEGAKVSW